MEEFHKHSGAFCLCLKITTLYDKTIYTRKLLPKNENRVLPLHHSCTLPVDSVTASQKCTAVGIEDTS